MRNLKIELSSEEEKVFEYRMYQFQGIQIAVNQFLSTKIYEYNDEHYSRLTDTLVEKYRLLSECIMELAEKRGYKEIAMQDLNYEYTKGVVRLIST